MHEWLNSKVHKMNWVDVGLLKICVFCFTMMMVLVFPKLLLTNWKWYAIPFAITYIYLVWKIYIKK